MENALQYEIQRLMAENLVRLYYPFAVTKYDSVLVWLVSVWDGFCSGLLSALCPCRICGSAVTTSKKKSDD